MDEQSADVYRICKLCNSASRPASRGIYILSYIMVLQLPLQTSDDDEKYNAAPVRLLIIIQIYNRLYASITI